MPELPEVQTTVTSLKKTLPCLSIKDVWSCYDSPYYKGKENIKDKNYFKKFKKEVTNKTILDVDRKGKNILFHLSNEITVLTHMKMTGHYLYGRYRKTTNKEKSFLFEDWIADEKGPLLKDPFNRFIRLVFTLSNKKHLVLSDARKFATIFIYPTPSPPKALTDLGPDPLERSFSFKRFLECLPYLSRRPIKQVLLDQTILSGIGNIYSDEILWSAGIHPRSIVSSIPKEKLYEMYCAMKTILRQGIDLKGSSLSDYRQPNGERGSFQYRHKVYQKTGDPCPKKDGGVTEQQLIGGRSAHFCNKHQVLYIPKKNS